MEDIRCMYCGYEWSTKSILYYISCPRCLNKTKNEPKTKEENKLKEVFTGEDYTARESNVAESLTEVDQNISDILAKDRTQEIMEVIE